jgi:hypothetical protein
VLRARQIGGRRGEIFISFFITSVRMSAGGWDYLAFYVYFCFVWSDVDDLNYSNDFALKHFSAALSFLSDDLRA